MAENKRKEETELLSRIEAYRQEFSVSLENKFLQERDERHRNGEVFFEGYWVHKDLLTKIQQKLTSRGQIVFLEIHLLVFVILFFCTLLGFVFERFFLP
jgi:hypothetical protein